MKYDPNKVYKWEPNDTFTMSGEDFGKVLNALRAILATPEAQRILYIQQANNAIEDIIADAVEKNIIKEMEDVSSKE